MYMAVTADERPDPAELAQRIQETSDLSSFPRHQSVSLINNNNDTLRMTVMKEAWEDAGRSQQEPGSAFQLYYPDAELLIVDLS